MSEELKRRGRVAAALIAGPAVTVGMLGAGAAPVMAQGEGQTDEDQVNEQDEPTTDGDGTEDQDPADDASESPEDQDDGDAASEISDEETEASDEEHDAGDGAGSTDPANDGDPEDTEPAEVSTPRENAQDSEGGNWEDNPLDVDVDPNDEAIFEDAYDGELEPYVVTQDAPASQQAGGDPAGYIPAGDIVPVLFRDDVPGEAYITATAAAPGAYVQDWEQYLTPYQQDEDESDDEADLEKVTPEAPARYDNTVVVPEVEGVTYQAQGEPVEPGTELTLSEDAPSLSVTALADEGYEFTDTARSWSFQWDPGFEDLWPTDPPDNWEADEDRWYANVPETHLPDYADWVLVHANNANRNADSWQEFEADTQVHLAPNTDAETIGDAFPTDGAVWWGYLENEDFWMIVHQYTGAAGFLPGESHLGDTPEEEEASISVDSETDVYFAGDEIAVTGVGFEAGEDVEFTFGGESVGTASANDEGEAPLEFTVPEDTESAPHTLEAVGLESEIQASITFHIAASDEDDDEEEDNDDEGGDEDSSGEGGQGGPDEGGSGPGDEDDADDETSAELSIDSSEVVAGEEVTLVGENFEAGEEVEFALNPELGTFSADDEGVVTAVVTIPEDTEPGEHTITATGLSSEQSDSVEITVVEPEGSGAEDEGEGSEAAPAGGTSDDDEAPAAEAEGEELAATGFTAGNVGLVSGLLLLIGGGLAALGFKNRLGRRNADA